MQLLLSINPRLPDANRAQQDVRFRALGKALWRPGNTQTSVVRGQTAGYLRRPAPGGLGGTHAQIAVSPPSRQSSAARALSSPAQARPRRPDARAAGAG